MTRRRCSGGKIWEVPFVEEFGLLGCRCHRNGKGTRETEKGRWWRDAHICRSKNVSLGTRCERVASHVFSTALNGSANWPWRVKISRLALRPVKNR